MPAPETPGPPQFLCPKCGKQLDPAQNYHEGEDEGSGDVLMPYAAWQCPECRHITHDYDDEFKYVKNGVVADD